MQNLCGSLHPMQKYKIMKQSLFFDAVRLSSSLGSLYALLARLRSVSSRIILRRRK